MMTLNNRPCHQVRLPNLPFSSEAVVEKFTVQWHDAPVELVATAIAYCIFDS